MAVGAAVYAGAGYVFPQPVTVVFQVGVKPGVEALAFVYRIEASLEGFPQFIV